MKVHIKICLLITAIYASNQTWADDEENPEESNVDNTKDFAELHELIKDFEIANAAVRTVKKRELRKIDRDIRNLQVESITGTFFTLNNLLKRPAVCHEFIRLYGIENVVLTALDFPNDNVKSDALLILRTIFEVIPDTARFEMPEGVLEKVMKVFVKVGSFPVKKRALDIFHIWLPNNPGAQATVMQVGGVIPFYSQLPNLDSESVHDMLDLFIKIVEEHVAIIKSIGPKTEDGLVQLQAYENVKLFKQISSNQICSGIPDFLDSVWSDRDNYIPQMCRLLKVLKPFCLRRMRGKYEFIDFFAEIEKFVNNESNKNFFDNVTEVKQMIKTYKKVVLGKHTEL